MCTSVLLPLTKGLIHFTPGRLMRLFRTQMATFRTRCCLDAPVTLLECQRSGTYHQALVFVCRPLPKAPLFRSGLWTCTLTSPTSGAPQARRISLHAADNISLTLAHFRFHREFLSPPMDFKIRGVASYLPSELKHRVPH